MTISALRKYFESGATRSLEVRLRQLRLLKEALGKYEAGILEALHRDLKKPSTEAYAGEIAPVLSEIDFVMKNLSAWMKSRRTDTPFWTISHFAGSSFTLFEPRGVVLIIGPWNYPFNLVLMPLVGAIAAGNCAVIKPSELTPHSSALLAEILKSIYASDFVDVVEGGADAAEKLLQDPFDLIFFTGSGHIGQKVMAAAAQNLTPVVLELGGKSPCLVDRDVELDVAVRRIAWGKFFNAGQTCVAPDYVLVPKEKKSLFLDKITQTIEKFYGSNPQQSSDYARIVNDKHFQRLQNQLNEGRLVTGGRFDAADLYISPTIVTDLPDTSRLLNEEIFGPILPVIEYENLDEAFQYISKRSKPLAFYIFSNNKAVQEKAFMRISAGGVCINDVIVHLTNSSLPFGGVGSSGMGRYHGKAGFEAFSHEKSIESKPAGWDIPFRYPPYRLKLTKLVKKFI